MGYPGPQPYLTYYRATSDVNQIPRLQSSKETSQGEGDRQCPYNIYCGHTQASTALVLLVISTYISQGHHNSHSYRWSYVNYPLHYSQL